MSAPIQAPIDAIDDYIIVQGVDSPLTQALTSTPDIAGIGAGGGPPLPVDTSVGSDSAYLYRAKALYACACVSEWPRIRS